MNSGFVELHSKGDASTGLKCGQVVFIAIDKVAWISGKTTGSSIGLDYGSIIMVTESVEEIQTKFSEAFSTCAYESSVSELTSRKKTGAGNGKR